MKACKCDRCKEYYEPYSPIEEIHHSNGVSLNEYGDGYYIQRKSYDLCPMCMIKLIKFLEHPEVNY